MGKRRGWGTIDRLPSGRYRARYAGPDTVVHAAPFTFDAKGDAEAWLSDERRLITSGAWTPPKLRAAKKYARATTLREYANEWLPRHKRSDGQPLKDRTVAHYRVLLDTRILPALGDLPLNYVTASAVEEWHEAQGAATPTYTAHAYQLLHSLMGSAEREGLIAENPCRIRGASKAKRSHRIEPASLEELTTIVEHLPEQYRVLALLTAWCALRFGEATELRRRDVDLTNGVVKVRRAVVLVNGERRVTTPKSTAGVRDVAIPPHLLPAVRDHVARFAEKGPDGLVFPGPRGGHLSQSTLNGKPARTRLIKGVRVSESASGFIAAREAAGRPDLHWHDLRHTGAVLAAQSGATLAELMARLGHSTPSAAMIYQHAARGRDAVIAQKLSELAGAAATKKAAAAKAKNPS